VENSGPLEIFPISPGPCSVRTFGTNPNFSNGTAGAADFYARIATQFPNDDIFKN
jgi:hypothetical protein